MSSVQSVSENNFQSEVIENQLPVVVDFYADWCPPCRRLGPILDRMAEEFAGKVKFVKVDSDAESQLAERFQVTGLPTVIFFERGQIVGQFAGLPQEDALRNELVKWINQNSSLSGS